MIRLRSDRSTPLTIRRSKASKGIKAIQWRKRMDINRSIELKKGNSFKIWRNETRRRLNFHIVHFIEMKNVRNIHSPLGITQWKREISSLLLLLLIKQSMMLEWTISFQSISVSVSLISISTKLRQFSDRRNFFLIVSLESKLKIDWSA